MLLHVSGRALVAAQRASWSRAAAATADLSAATTRWQTTTRSLHTNRATLLPIAAAQRYAGSQLVITRATPVLSARATGHSLLLPFLNVDPAAAASAAARQPRVPSLPATLRALDRMHDVDERHAQYESQHPPVSKKNMFRTLWHDYGYVGVGTYLGVYVGTLGMMYVSIRSGMLGADTVLRLVSQLGLESHFSDLDPAKGDFLMAWVATKLTEPLRAALTMAVTPRIARAVGRAPPKKKQEKDE